MIYQETLKMLKKAAEPNTPTDPIWGSMKKDLLKPRAVGAPALPALIGRNRQGTGGQPRLDILKHLKEQNLMPRPMVQPIGLGGIMLPKLKQQQQRRYNRPFQRSMLPSGGFLGKRS